MNIKNTLECSSYPTPTVEEVIGKEIVEKISKRNSQIIKREDIPKVRYIKLPYIGIFSEQLCKKLQKLSNQHCKEKIY